MTEHDGKPGICVIGQHELDYPRNNSLRETIARLGYRVVHCHSRIRTPYRTADLMWQYLKVWRRVDAVLVTEGGHAHVPYLKVLCLLTGRPLLFDPFLSRYSTRVEDRKLAPARSFRALQWWWQDWAACAAADYLLFDTQEHADYFRQRYRPRAQRFVLEVGVDEDCFRPAPPGANTRVDPSGITRVLFYGTYIPLQGVEHIIEAARLLRDHPIQFRLIGTGQTREAVGRLAEKAQLENIEWLDWASPEQLVQELHQADICLGIFGDTAKAARVVANKVVQGAACGRPIVTKASPAVERYFTDGKDAVLVPAGAEGLAAAILRLSQDPALRSRLAAGARETFLENFSLAAQAEKLGRVLDHVRRRPGQRAIRRRRAPAGRTAGKR